MSCAKYPTGYPITAVMAARRLRGGGETLSEIADFIEEQYGTRPTVNTVSSWTNRRAAATRKRHNTERIARWASKGASTGAKLGRSEHSPEFRLARMRALHGIGLKPPQIARIMAFDYGDVMSRDTVERAIAAGTYPRGLR